RCAGERRELVFLLCLDRKGRLLACKRLAEGDVASADLNIRKVVEMALLTSASAVILAHNHPSGVAVPSSSDEAATRQVAEALRTIGVRLVDHIVVADRASSPWRTAATCWGKEGAGSPLEPPPPVCGLANAPKALGRGILPRTRRGENDFKFFLRRWRTNWGKPEGFP
ncbi:MAG: JAB domain-containing protein, partial [Dysosmobacter welbionis]